MAGFAVQTKKAFAIPMKPHTNKEYAQKMAGFAVPTEKAFAIPVKPGWKEGTKVRQKKEKENRKRGGKKAPRSGKIKGLEIIIVNQKRKRVKREKAKKKAPCQPGEARKERRH